MKFLKNYALTLILSYVFVFFGGWQLFDFNGRWWLATACCAFIAAAVLTAFLSQEEKIEKLENRVKELEEKTREKL